MAMPFTIEVRWLPGREAVDGIERIALAFVLHPVWPAGAGQPHAQTPSCGLSFPTTCFTTGQANAGAACGTLPATVGRHFGHKAP